MNNLTKVISNKEIFEGEIRTLSVDGKPYFVASDIAKALGYKEPHKAVSNHCRYGIKHDVPHPQSKNKTLSVKIIPEGDIYRLIMKSKLPKAQEFESWVCDEVLPTMRKTGGYVSNDETFLNTYFPNVDEQSKVLFKGILEQVRISNEKIKQQQQELIQKQEDIIELEGKVEVWENIFGQKDTYGFDELAKIFANEFPNLPNGKKTGRNNFFQYLRNDGVLRYNNTPYQTYSHYFKLIPHEYGIKTVIKNDGIKWLMKRIRKQF